MSGNLTFPYQTISGGWQITVIPLSSEMIIGAQTPIPLLPAPGAGYQYVVHYVFYNSNFGTTNYSTGGSAFQVWYGTSISLDIGDAYLFAQGYSGSQQSLPYSAYEFSPLNTSICENCPLFLWAPNGSYTGGDGTGSVTLFYSTLQLV